VTTGASTPRMRSFIWFFRYYSSALITPRTPSVIRCWTLCQSNQRLVVANASLVMPSSRRGRNDVTLVKFLTSLWSSGPVVSRLALSPSLLAPHPLSLFTYHRFLVVSGASSGHAAVCIHDPTM
jgi:hypothetical protein